MSLVAPTAILQTQLPTNTDTVAIPAYIPPIERDVRRTVRAERMELVRELDGEQAYEKMRRAVERASQPPTPSQFPSRKGPERSGPKRGGPERDFGPSR